MKVRGMIAALLVLCLLLTGCSAPQEVGEPEIGNAGAAGRYLEEETAFPALDHIYALQQVAPDRFYAMGQQGEQIGVWHSADGGASWEQQPCPDLVGLGVLSVAFAPDGSFYASCFGEYTEEGIAVTTVRVDGETVTVLSGMPDEYNWGMALTASGALVIDRSFSFIRAEPATGRTVEHDLGQGQTFPGSYVVYDETFAFLSGGHIRTVDTETGETGEVPIPIQTGYGAALAVEEDRSGFFFCTAEGLYRVTMDGAITEQLIDGALCSFGMPSVYVSGLYACPDGSFLLLCQGEGSIQLLRYAFHPELEREPGRQLSVYSLRENDYIRQAIGLYQRENPDIIVKLEVGLPEGTAVTAEDAVRVLATELLAGDAPDLLVLDGLPVQGYVRNGALLDLEGALSDRLPELLPNAAAAYQDESGLYAIPTRVTMPLLAGTDIGEIDGLGGLADYLEARGERRFQVPDEELSEMLWDLCAPRWFGEDGALDPEALAADLADLERLAAISHGSEDRRWAGSYLTNQAMYWAGGGFPLVFGSLERLEDLAELYTAIDMLGAGELKPFPTEGGAGCLVPGTVLGVNAAGDQTDLAVEFVRFALDDTVQRSTRRGGMPVNRTSLEQIALSKEPGTEHSSFGSGYNDTGEEYSMRAVWPSEEQMLAVVGMMQAAEVAAWQNEVVRQMVLSGTVDMLINGDTAENTAALLVQKVERYLQEQAAQ